MSDLTELMVASGFMPNGTMEASHSSACLITRTVRPARCSKSAAMVLKPMDMLSSVPSFISS
ncbi:hypothetical protein D3C84_1179060 [compost metagenome]